MAWYWPPFRTFPARKRLRGFFTPLVIFSVFFLAQAHTAWKVGPRLIHQSRDRRAPQLTAERYSAICNRADRVGVRAHRADARSTRMRRRSVDCRGGVCSCFDVLSSDINRPNWAVESARLASFDRLSGTGSPSPEPQSLEHQCPEETCPEGCRSESAKDCQLTA